jgi:hypothetical protein
LSLSFIDNTKTRISNIVVVYIDAVSISFIHLYIFKIFLQEESSPANEYKDR